MATTEDPLLEAERLEEVWRRPSAEPEPARSDASPRGARPLRPGLDWSRPLLVTWGAVMIALMIFEPRPTDPTATPLWGELLLFGFTYALLACVVGLAIRRRWGLGTSALAGGMGMVIAAACAVTGHHAGAWWVVEGVAFTGLATGSLIALRDRR
ncbi:MAG: hypothetical protein M3346_02175 [Actinomycetota bacterium]|nr:hypothetical protein [Actinomycetota bacterium]